MNRHKSGESTSSSKKELAAFIQKSIKDGLRKELNSTDKKRKSDSDEEFDMTALEKSIDEFNYEDMNNLKIDSEDEVSVWRAGEDACGISDEIGNNIASSE